MAIKPYNSNTKPCFGETVATVTFGENVANVKFYIIDAKLETLISGPVCEQLKILKINCRKLDIGTTPVMINDQEKTRIRSKFPKIFQGVGTLKNYEVEFHIDEKVTPHFQIQRQVPHHLRGKLQSEIDTLLADDTIEEHSGPAPLVSNLVLQPKDDGSIRTTLDMSNANKAIKKTNIPIPRPEQIKSMLAGYKVFSKLDLKSAFHQLAISEKSRLLTIFYGLVRLYRYKRLTMGSYPATGVLNKALRPLFAHLKDTLSYMTI